jgi:3-oxoacyl-[acyl-carrier protein] reductase
MSVESASLESRVALVTGAGTGIGRAVAEEFARQGARVVVNYSRSRDAAEEVVTGIRGRGGSAVAIGADVSDEASVRTMIAEIDRQFGRLDYLVNNAGWSQRVPHAQLDDLTDDIWDRVFNTNLRGAFYCVRAAVPLLKRQPGSAIVNIASVAALMGQGSSIAYAASKGGMVTMTRSLARALAPAIRVNALLPGFVRTRFANWPDEAFDSSEKITPLRRLPTTQECGVSAVFLAAHATAITGETLIIDGGMAELSPAL